MVTKTLEQGELFTFDSPVAQSALVLYFFPSKKAPCKLSKETIKIKLHEIELNAKDPDASKKFYHDILGLPVAVDQNGLKVFDSGWAGIDVDVSTHYPHKTSISFLVEDLDKYISELQAKGIKVDAPYDTHLGMRAIAMQDPDGHRIEIHCPTQKSPQWLKDMIK